jgi:predicted N-acyltransferase
MVAAELVVERTDELDCIDPAEWDRVVTEARAPVFYSHGFVAAYHRAPLAPIDGYRYLVVRRRGDGTAVAVVPAYLQQRPDPIGCLAEAYPEVRGAALLSHVWHCYDGRLAATIDHDELVPAVVDALRDEARALGAEWFGLINVSRDGATGEAVRAAGLPLRHLLDRFTMDLRGITSLDDYLGRLGHGRRHTLRRNQRRAEEAGVTTEVLPVARAGLDEMAALSAKTAARFGNTSFYRPDTFADFVRALGSSAGTIEVRQRGRLVGNVVYLVDAQRFHAWTGGVDYEVDGNFSAYRVMHVAFMALAIELGVPILEGGRGNAAFKLPHGLSPLPLDAMILPA